MTVVNPKSISGINSITTGSGSDNLLTIHTNDGTERVRVDSTGTTKIVTGIVTTLTATTGIVTTLTTNTLTANSTAKVGSGVTLSPDGDVFATGVTTSTTVNVGAAVTISESGIEASGIGITCASINGTQIGGRRNLVINGAMQVAQRGTSSTSNGYQTVDRYNLNASGVDEAPTIAQVDVSSSDSGDNPFTKGLTKAIRLTNGNQTSGAGAADRIRFWTILEAQTMRNSGWNYNSTSSYVTLSFYVKSSVSQNFFVRLTTGDGTSQSYIVETGTLTANTWTRVVKTIPGNSNIQFDDDVNAGFYIVFVPFRGTDNTGTRPLNAWAAFDASTMYPDMTSTWYTTNDATFEVTGLQLEVGSQATPFEHRSFGEELALCQRYFYMAASGADSSTATVALCMNYSSASARAVFQFPVTMRTIPDIYSVGGTNYFKILQPGGTTDLPDSVHGGNERPNMAELSFEDDVAGMTAGQASLLRLNNAAARIGFTAEI